MAVTRVDSWRRNISATATRTRVSLLSGQLLVSKSSELGALEKEGKKECSVNLIG